MAAKKENVIKEVPKEQTTLVSEEVEESQPEKSDRFKIIIEDNGPGVVKKQIQIGRAHV